MIREDKTVNSGQPSINGIMTNVLFYRFMAGDSTLKLCQDYSILCLRHVEEAIRFEIERRLLHENSNSNEEKTEN